MERINYDGRKFRPIHSSATGEAGQDTVFYYHQSGNIVWAEYSGGEIVRGHLIAICNDDSRLDMRYHHVNQSGEVMTGVCQSSPEFLSDGRLRLYEKWHWTSGNPLSGTSIIEEFNL